MNSNIATSSYTSITWTSSATNVATIDQDGKVTAIAPGTTTITAVLTNGLSRDITVTRDIKVLIPIQGISIDESSTTLYIEDNVNDHATLHITYNPTVYEVDDTIEWTSSNPNVVTVNSNGVVTGLAPGTVTITASAAHYNGAITSTASVEVKVLATNYNITNHDSTRMNMEVGDTFDYETEIIPSNSSYRTVSWESSDPTKVSVDQTGHIEALSPGTVTITTVLTNGLGRDITTTREVKVLIPITGFNIVENSIDLYIGDATVDNQTLTKQYTPTVYEVDDTITWTSADTNVATVDSTGKVTAVGNGTTTITGKVSHYGDQYVDTATVNVTTLALNFDITNQNENDEMEMEVTDEFEYEILPATSSYTSITWTSSATNVATVDQNGKVTAVAPGQTTITAVLTNGLSRDITVTRDVKVLIPITGFDVTENSVDLYYGDPTYDHTTLHPVFTPTTYEVDDTIEWTSDDTDVVTVENGVITAGTIEGTATITARLTHYGNTFTDTVTVNTYVLAQEFNITNQTANTEKEMEVGQEFTY